MSGGSKHKPAEELHKSMNFEPTCKTPALRKSLRVRILAGGGDVLPLIGQCFYQSAKLN